MAYDKARIKLLDKNTGQVLKEVDPYTSADAVTCADGSTVEDKLASISTTVTNNSSDLTTVINTDITNINNKDAQQDNRLTNIENKDAQQDTRLTNIETANTTQDNTINALKTKNSEQDGRLNDIAFTIATGSATTIVVAMNTDYSVNGYTKTFIAVGNNAGAATTLNGKSLYKPNTTTAPNIIAGKAYTVWYDKTKDCFFVKASAEGTAVAANVLALTTFSNDSDTGIQGTMPNITADQTATSTTTSGTTIGLKVPKGYWDGTHNVNATSTSVDGNLVSANIKAGKTILGVSGSSTVVDTADAYLDANYLMTGYSGYDDGVKKSGQMANNGSYTNPVNTAVGGNTLYARIPKGAYMNVTGSNYPEITINDPNFVASNILSTANIFGLIGSATIQSMGGISIYTGTSTPFVSNQNVYINLSSIGHVPTILVGLPSSDFSYTRSGAGVWLRPSIQFIMIYNYNGKQFASSLVGYDTVGGRYTSVFTGNFDYGSTFSVDMSNFPVLQNGSISAVSGTISWMAIG